MSKIRIVLADDHPVMLDGVRNLLEQEADISVVGEAVDGNEALRLAKELQPDVLVLDMEMPGLQGVEVARRLRAADSSVRILALSAYDDRQYILSLLASGAAGYLIKEEAPDTIVDAVRGVARGEDGWLSRRVSARVAEWTQRGEQAGGDLTDREMDVLRLVAEGKTNQEIGHALGISPKTVEKHLEGVFAKLDVSSRVEAAVRAVRDELV